MRECKAGGTYCKQRPVGTADCLSYSETGPTKTGPEGLLAVAAAAAVAADCLKQLCFGPRETVRVAAAAAAVAAAWLSTVRRGSRMQW